MQACFDGEVWLREMNWINLKRIHRMSRTVEPSMQGSKIWFYNPVLRYMCEVPNWICFAKKTKFKLKLQRKKSLEDRGKTVPKHTVVISQNQDFDGSFKITDTFFLFFHRALRFNADFVGKKCCGDGKIWRWRPRWINPKRIHWMFRTVEISMQVSKKLIVQSYATLYLRSFWLRFFSDEKNIQTVVTENQSFKSPVKKSSKPFLEVSRNQNFDGSVKYLTFFSCCLIQLWGFGCRLCWEKNKHIVTKNFDVEKRVKPT